MTVTVTWRRHARHTLQDYGTNSFLAPFSLGSSRHLGYNIPYG